MNWYKQIKLASPLAPSGDLSYFDIGHEGPDRGQEYPDVILWFIDSDFGLSTWRVSPYAKHSSEHWPEMMLQNEENTLATGRYCPHTHRSSVNLVLYNENPNRQSYIENKIVSILDKKFNNPKIFML